MTLPAKHGLSAHLTASLLISAALLAMPPLGRAAESPNPPPAASKHSFLDPIAEFANDSILRPTAPFELIPGKDPNGWSFVIEPYIWAMGLSGKTGVAGLPPLDVNYNARRVLQQLDWAIMGMGEIHKGRWGLLADGYYAALSGSGNLEGILYRDGSIQLQQAIASLALSYRIIDDRRGFLDVYAGARYNYLGMQIDTTVDPEGVRSFSDAITDRLAGGIDSRLSNLLSGKSGILAANAQVLASDIAETAKKSLTERALKNIAEIPRPIREALRDSDVRRIFRLARREVSDYVSAVAAYKVAAAKGQPSAALQSRVDATKKNLSARLASELQDALPTHAAASRWWVDPIIGLRGQINLTKWLFLAAQGDVGGFGAGSQITWNAQATIGVNFTRNIFAELGYRYMYVDYNKDNFLYQMNTFGIFSSLGVKF